MTTSAFGVVHSDISKADGRKVAGAGALAGVAGGALYLGTRGRAGGAAEHVAEAASAVKSTGRGRKVAFGAAGGLGLAAGAAKFVSTGRKATTGLGESTTALHSAVKDSARAHGLSAGRHRR